MRKISHATLLALLLILPSGCAIAPLQEEVTHIPTPLIVRSIRCETRDAIRGQLAAYLLALPDDPAARAIGARLRDRDIPLSRIDLRPLNRELKRSIAGFKKYAVTYDFTFDGKIVNNIDGDLTITDTFESGSRGVPFTAKMDRSRQNIQTFRQTDTFGGLLRDTPPEYCPDPHRNAPRNYVYPISGKIGIVKQLNDFLSLNEYGALAAPASDKNGPPVFASTITFTTTIQGTVDPTIVISPVTNSVTRSGGFGLTSARTDMHQVIVAFAAFDAVISDAEIDRFLAPLAPVAPRAGKTVEEIASENAVDNSILRFEIGRQVAPVIVNRSLLSLF